DAACAKVTAKLGEWSAEKAEREYPALSRLLGLRSASAGEPAPEELKRETFDAVARLLLGKSQDAPVVLMLEDLHWIDGGSRELTRPVDEIRIPGTVQEVIAARLDRLGSPAKRVVQVAAVLGRQFHRAQLARVLDGEGIDLERALAELESRGIIHRKSLLASDEYRFGESLTQEVAYEGLLLKQRRQLHERVALQLESEPGKAGPERTALLAHHWARSDDRVKAMVALLRAAQDAEDLPSYRTAVDFYRRLWELAETDPDDPASRRAALAATSGLSRLSVVFGWPPLDEAERAAGRARELAEALGDTDALPGILYFLGVITMLGEDFERGLALAEQGVAVAERAGNKLAVMRLSRGLAVNYAIDGRFELARRAMRWVMDELEPTEHRARLSDLYVSAR